MLTRLKSLELHGYKTFASKSLLEFAGNITAIVGPNGSGKSNVADAMRWVLGEQSYSLLRAKKTDDMIFAGSERRPRAGMASATVTFDNSDNWLPIDYTEVSITRRAYRDGQNEYLLNGQRVRLKEINELLGRSGLAERTYTVIGQGLVDAALSLRPEERRRFFEEAAGIQLYRRRRDEALGRMDTTRRNMDRVLDILSEIKPRLKSLERQAARVEEYERITADLRLLLRDWYGYHWHRTQQEIQHAQEVYRIREEALSKVREQQHTVEGNISRMRLDIHDSREQLNRWHSESSKYHQERENISRQLAVFDERQRALHDQRGEFENSKTRLTEEIQALEDRLQSYRSERDQLKAEVNDATRRMEEASTQLRQRLAERAVLENQLRNERREVTQLETEQLRLSASKVELDHRIHNLEDNLQVLDEQVGLEKKAVEKSTVAFTDLAEELKNAELDLTAMGEELNLHQEKIKVNRQKLETLRKERDAVSLSLTKAQAQLKVLLDAERSFSGLNQGSKLLLKSAQNGTIKGNYRALNGFLDVPVRYEIAAAAVLGEVLDAVLLGSDADLSDALSLLERGETGRTLMVIEETVSQAKTPTVQLPEQCHGAMLDLIEIPAGMETTFQRLFANAYVMDDRDAARKLAKNLPPNACAVTLQGEIFRGDGIVIVSREGGKSAVIARPRQMRELQNSVSDLEKKLSIANQNISTSEQQIQAFLGTERQLQDNLRVLQTQRNSAEKSFRQVQLETRQAEERLKFQVLQQGKALEQIEKALSEIKTSDQRLQDLGEDLELRRTAIRERQRTLNEIPILDLQQEENHWKMNLAVANRALQDAEQRVQDYERNTNDSVARLSALSGRMESHTADLETLGTEQQRLVDAERSITEKIELLNVLIKPAEEHLETLEQEYTRTQDELSLAQQASSTAERNETQAQIELGRQRDALESLREKIQEDFGLVAFQYENEIAGQETLPFGDMVEKLPRIMDLPQGLNDEIRRNRALLRRLGAINFDAKHEFDEVFERHEFLTQQLDDLTKADANLTEVIRELNDLMKLEFRKTFDAVAAEFKELFTRLFGGGTARLEMTDEDNPTEAGIEIHAKLPGKREQGLALLSGGERSLTAVALVFSLLKVSPTPFCILDEVDAMLDESNVGRFCDLLKELSEMGTQFIVITHNRGTVQSSDVIYGVTKGTDSSSQLISLKLDEVSEEMAQ